MLPFIWNSSWSVCFLPIEKEIKDVFVGVSVWRNVNFDQTNFFKTPPEDWMHRELCYQQEMFRM